MSDEAVCIETPTKFARYTIADGTAIPFGTLLKLTDPNTAIINSADGDAFAGIVWVAKTASDGIVEVVAALNGVWDLTDGGVGFSVGELLSIDGTPNEVRLAVEADVITGSIVGKALETAGANEVVRVRVGEMF